MRWYTFKVRQKFSRWPRRWTYRKPLKYPREIRLRGTDQLIGIVHRELDGDGRVWYRIDGTDIKFDYLGGAGDSLYARTCMEDDWRKIGSAWSR